MQLLFSGSNLWFRVPWLARTVIMRISSGAASAQLDLSTYAGVVAGSRRSPGSAPGTDILAAGDWQASILNRQLFVLRKMPYGLPPGSVQDGGPTVLAGIPVSVANATPPPTPAQEELPAQVILEGRGLLLI